MEKDHHWTKPKEKSITVNDQVGDLKIQHYGYAPNANEHKHVKNFTNSFLGTPNSNSKKLDAQLTFQNTNNYVYVHNTSTAENA